MRITPSMTADNAVYNLQTQRSQLDALQEQVSSGVLVNRPSDDPLTARQLLTLQNQLDQGDQYTSNIQKAQLALNVTNTALTGMTSVMSQITKIASDMVNGSSNPADRNISVSNLAQLKAQLVDYGNTQSNGQYVFAGYKTAMPFDPAGTFSGTDDVIQVQINDTAQVGLNLSGGKLLRGGTPPAAVGSGATAGSSPVDILGSIDSLITAINNNDTQGINDGYKNLHAGQDQINVAQTDVAGRLIRLENSSSMISSNQATLKNIIGNLDNVDYAKAAVQLSQQTTAFNAALSTTAKINALSLIDYMK